MVFAGGLAVELNGFLEVLAAAPAELVAECGSVACFCMSMFRGRNEERERAVVIRMAFGEETGSVSVREVVLSEWVGAIGELLQNTAGLT